MGALSGACARCARSLTGEAVQTAAGWVHRECSGALPQHAPNAMPQQPLPQHQPQAYGLPSGYPTAPPHHAQGVYGGYAPHAAGQGYGAPQAHHPAAPRSGESGEAVFYQTAGVVVTSKRAVIGDVTYVLANVTSVTRWTQPRPFWVLLVGLLLGVVPVPLVLPMSPEQGRDYIPLIAVGALFLIAYFAVLRPKHWVRICTAGQETDAIHYRAVEGADRVVAALNQAIVSR